MECNSEIAANRTIKVNDYGEKINKNVRYRKMPYFEIYNLFEYKSQVKYSTFCKYVGKEYKNPHRASDICDYCEYGKKIKKEILDYIVKIDEYVYAGEFDFDSNHLLGFLNQRKDCPINTEIITKIKDCQEIEYHQNIAKRQRSAYNNQRSDLVLLANSILIELDFKEKVVIGLDPRQVSSIIWHI